jgi:epoxyqueuosine reductase QueG
VSVAVRLSDAVMNPIDDRPTELYAAHYQRVNDLLDRIALRVTNFLQDRGAHALPLPASQILDEEVFYSYLSHKAVAVAAGVGWQGKSLLLVTRQFGPRVRLITVLTDAPLTPDQPVKNKCGKCTICADACPAGAIHGQGTDSHYDDRSQAWDKNKCVTRLNQVAGQGHVYKYLCGVCVAACPWGRKGKRG